jgi:hypothetical protein
MSDHVGSPAIAKAPFWRRGLAGFLDFVTVFWVGGYVIGAMSAETTTEGFNLTGSAALMLLGLILLYFYLGWKVVGGTIWQRVFGARPM